jgi:hypothetical protein
MRGKVQQRQGAPADQSCTLELEHSEGVTVLETQQRKIVYEGVIFDASDVEIVNRPALLESAFGYYTYVVLEKRTGEIVIGTDRFGFSPLYYSRASENLQFSSSITLLKGVLDRLTPNMDAWDELLVLGNLVGEKTVVNEIERLQWGRKISISNGQIRFLSVWNPETPPLSTLGDYVERNNELLLDAIRLSANAKRNRIVALTGGQDSRRIAVAMRSAGVEMTCVTQRVIGNSNKDKDTLIAQDVASALGVRHLRLEAPSEDALRLDRSLKDYWSGYESNYHEWAVNLMRHLPRGSLIYDGIVGDVTVNGHFFRAHPAAIAQYNDVDFLSRMLCGQVSSNIDQRLVSVPVFERVRADLARYPDSAHRLTFFFVLNHTRRNIGSWLRLYSLFGHQPCMPYLHYPLFLQSLSLDPNLYLDRWMQKECTQLMNPQVAAIPSTRDPIPQKYLSGVFAPAALETAGVRPRRALRSDVKHYLPGLPVRRYAHDVASRLPFESLKERWGWASDLGERFSEFLDWIENKDVPAFPSREAESIAPGTPAQEVTS